MSELHKRLRIAGLRITGRKAGLLACLREHLAATALDPARYDRHILNTRINEEEGG